MRAEGMHAVFERGRNSEIAAATTHRPEQVRVFGLTCCEEAAIGRNYIDRKQIVAT